ncbi:MAG: ParB N-terminal domain-containing protein [Thermodesulfobacteriota bacterium]
MGEAVQQEVTLLNERLDALPYRLEIVGHDRVKHLEKNANYMTDEQFQRLRQNVMSDGALMSVPLCFEDEDGRYVILSGNHRVMAAVKAGVEQFLVMVLKERPSRQEAIAIQLSHNAIHGQDDKQTLKDLWREIEDLNLKLYSGLSTKEIEALERARYETIKEEPVKFEEVSLLFLPEEVEELNKVLEDLKGKHTKFAGRIVEFADILEGIMAVKKHQDIINSALAFLVLAQAVRDYLDGKEPSLDVAIEEGTGERVLFHVGHSKWRIRKATAAKLRQTLTELTKQGSTVDEAILSLIP